MNNITVGVLTVSDRCYRKEAVDESGPRLMKLIEGGVVENGTVVETALVPDIKEDIEKVLCDWSDAGIGLILTTGGTGVAERDVTPEATATVLEKVVPGIPKLVFKHSSKVTPLAALSRGMAGVRGKSLIINLPGSKKASQECLEAIAGVIPHAVDLINGRTEEVKNVHSSLGEKKSSVIPGAVASRKRESAYVCVDVSTAQKIIMDRICFLRKEKMVSYKEAQGYVLTNDVVAQDNLPSFDASLKDGYAVLTSDGTFQRKMIAVSDMGRPPPLTEVSVGECVRVSTGGAVPAGANAVVQVEDTLATSLTTDGAEESMITLKKIPCSGLNIRKRGSDFKMGQLLLARGTYLDSPAVGLMAAAGVTSVRVFEKPLVAVISTGDELLNPEEALTPGKVRDSNRFTLLSLLKEEGFPSVDLGIAVDEPDALRSALEKGFRAADVVVTTGSMSMGERDYLKEVLVADFDAEICFGRVWMRPGKPTSFAILKFEGRPKMWFGLPGNPASAWVTAHLFLLPALKKISGLQNVFPMRVNARMEKMYDLPGDRPHYVRAFLTYVETMNCWIGRVTESQMSSCIGGCTNANGFVLIPEVMKETPTSTFGQAVKETPTSDFCQAVKETPTSDFCQAVKETPTSDFCQAVKETPTSNFGVALKPTTKFLPETPQNVLILKAFLIGKNYT